MQDAQDLENITAHAIRDDIGQLGDDQLTSRFDAPRVSEVRMVGEMLYGVQDAQYHACSSLRIIGCSLVYNWSVSSVSLLRTRDMQGT